MLSETLDNIALLLGIDSIIIPTIITFFVIVFLIILTFRMNQNGITATLIVIALYTVSMGLLAFLGIDSPLNIFSLLGDSLGLAVISWM